MSIEQLFVLVAFFSYLAFQALMRLRKGEPPQESSPSPEERETTPVPPVPPHSFARKLSERLNAEIESKTEAKALPATMAVTMAPTPSSPPGHPRRPVWPVATRQPMREPEAQRAPRGLRQVLADRDGLRQAMLLKAVLDPPLGLRPPR